MTWENIPGYMSKGTFCNSVILTMRKARLEEKYPTALNGCDVVFLDAEVYVPSPKEVYEDTTTQGPRIVWSAELILDTY